MARARFWLAAVLLSLAALSNARAAPFVPARDAHCVAFSPDGKLAATATSGLSNGEYPPRPHPSVRKAAVINIWDVATGQKLRRMETYGDFTRLEFSGDGKYLVSCRLFSLVDGAQLNEVRLWDPATGKSVHQFEACHGFALPQKGAEIAVLSRSKCVIYDIDTRERLGEAKPLGGAISVVYAPNEKLLAGVYPLAGHFVIRTVDLESGELLRQSAELEQPFYTLAMGENGQRLASGHAGGMVILWNTESLKPLARLSSGGRGLAHPFFSPDGSLLGAGDQENSDVVFWNASDGQEVARYTFERGTFRTTTQRPEDSRIRPEKDPARFAFSPDGESFLTGCYGGIIRLVTSGRDIRRFGD